MRLKEIGSPALTVVSNEFPGKGAMIVGALFAGLHATTTNCISRSTSEIKTPKRNDFTLNFTTKLPEVKLVKRNSPVIGFTVAGILFGLRFVPGVGLEKEKPLSNGTGIGRCERY